jgi:hypothetical protein
LIWSLICSFSFLSCFTASANLDSNSIFFCLLLWADNLFWNTLKQNKMLHEMSIIYSMWQSILLSEPKCYLPSLLRRKTTKIYLWIVHSFPLSFIWTFICLFFSFILNHFWDCSGLAYDNSQIATLPLIAQIVIGLLIIVYFHIENSIIIRLFLLLL